MERLGLVATTRFPRDWRPYAGPVAFLLVASVAIGFARVELRTHPATTRAAASPAHAAKARPHKRTFYLVHAGDTITGIASRTGIPTETLLKLNPTVSPTALFIGQKIRLR